jgi:hypothetical protein
MVALIYQRDTMGGRAARNIRSEIVAGMKLLFTLSLRRTRDWRLLRIKKSTITFSA